MFPRIVRDLYHLKRVHSMVPDDKLSQLLKTKLTALVIPSSSTTSESLSPEKSLLKDRGTGAAIDGAARVMTHQCPVSADVLAKLLDCLVYFKLTNPDVTVEAFNLAQTHCNSIGSQHLPPIVASCCLLSQYNANYNASLLLDSALGQLAAKDVCRLANCLADQGVQHEDVWHAVAEHALRNIDLFKGTELLSLLRIFHKVEVRYSDFYTAAERHIAAQPETFLSVSDLGEVIYIYKSLNLPIMTLLAAKAERTGGDFDDGLATLARTSTQGHSKGNADKMTGGGGGGRGQALHGSTSFEQGAGSDGDLAVVSAFTRSTLNTIRSANAVQLYEIAKKCESHQLLRLDVVTALIERLTVLQTLNRDDAQLVDLAQVVLRSCNGADISTAAASSLCGLLNIAAVELTKTYPLRVISVALWANQILPPRSQPRKLYEALVLQLSTDSNLVSSLFGGRLLEFVAVMLDLRAYGGHVVLDSNMDALTVIISNTPPKFLPELAVSLSTVPSARNQCLPRLYKTMTLKKNWERNISSRDSIMLVESMVKSRIRNNVVLQGVMKHVRSELPRYTAENLADLMANLALLHIKDIEFYTATSTYILEKSRQCTVHELSKMMYTFTFLLRGVIKVVQQMLPRLRVSAAQATPHDITITLYSLVKLRVDRHADVSTAMCDRAATTLQYFTPEELASTFTSLRTLNVAHSDILKSLVPILEEAAGHLIHGGSGSGGGGDHNVDHKTKARAALLDKTQFMSLVGTLAMLQEELVTEPVREVYEVLAIRSVPTVTANQLHLLLATFVRLKVQDITSTQKQQLLERAETLADALVNVAAPVPMLTGSASERKRPYHSHAKQQASGVDSQSSAAPGEAGSTDSVDDAMQKGKSSAEEASATRPKVPLPTAKMLYSADWGKSVHIVEVIMSLHDLGIPIVQPSFLLANASMQLSDIMAHEALREELKRRGILPMLTGASTVPTPPPTGKASKNKKNKQVDTVSLMESVRNEIRMEHRRSSGSSRSGEQSMKAATLARRHGVGKANTTTRDVTDASTSSSSLNAPEHDSFGEESEETQTTQPLLFKPPPKTQHKRTPTKKSSTRQKASGDIPPSSALDATQEEVWKPDRSEVHDSINEFTL